MSRQRQNSLPRYLELSKANSCYYYKNPSMPSKANLGKDESSAINVADSLNNQYRLETERKATKLLARIRTPGFTFEVAFEEFVAKYIRDYRLKSSTAQRLQQRQSRLVRTIGELQSSTIDTQVLREAVSSASQFE